MSRAINWNHVRQVGIHPRTFNISASPADMAGYVARNQYAWPGGYELVLIADDGACLCGNCVRAEYASIYSAAIAPADHSGWRPDAVGAIGADIDDSDGIVCGHCSRVIADGEGE